MRDTVSLDVGAMLEQALFHIYGEIAKFFFYSNIGGASVAGMRGPIGIQC